MLYRETSSSIDRMYGVRTKHLPLTVLPWSCKSAPSRLLKCRRAITRSPSWIRAYRDPNQQPTASPHLPAVSAATALDPSPATVPAPRPTTTAPVSVNSRSKETPTKAPNADTDSAYDVVAEKMSWTKQWWPMAVEESLDASLPHKITLMGRDLVLWKTAEGNWSCLDNACPHRGAPLDQGRLQGNCLQCSYHGWQFSTDGSCKDIPQSENPAKYCSMRAATVAAYPVKASQGLVWVWGEPGPAAAQEAAATPLKADPDVDEPNKYTWRFPWLDREVMVSYEYGLDNLFDIAHGPFAHDGVFGISAANNAPELPAEFELTPQQMSLLTVPSVKPGEKIDLAKSQSVGTGQKMTYNFPVMATADNFFVNSSSERTQDLLKLVVYRTPVRPGVSKVFYNMLLSTKMDPKQKKALTNTPDWDLHAKMLRFFDGDVVLIHDQERLVASKGGWRKAMFMPHPSDRGIAKFRAWFDKVGPIPYTGETTLGPIQPRHVVLNHYEQHSKTCKTCQKGISLLRKVQYGLYATASLLGLLSLKAAQLAPAGSSAAAVALFLTPYLGLVAAAGLVVAALKVKRYVQDSFYFKDYVQSRSGQ